MDIEPLLVAGMPESSDVTIDVTSPFDGALVARVAAATADHAERALAAAAQSRPLAAAIPLHERAAILGRIAAAIAQSRDALASLVEREAGKPITFARAEVDRAIDTFTESAVAARTLDGTVLPMDAYGPGAKKLGLVRAAPIGPVVAITPFNFPLNLVAHKVGPAIAAGCPVVVKPSPRTPATALALGRIVLEAGWPRAALSVLPAGGEIAARLADDPRPRLLSFTGSAVVGWSLRARAGTKKVVLELGGNAGAIVEPDADLERAAQRLALGAFAYAGQTCIKVQRVTAHTEIADRFRDAFTSACAAIPTGDPRLAATVCGPVIDDDAASRVTRWTDEAVAGGARRLTRAAREGRVLSPVLVEGVDPRASLWSEEVFGPVVCLTTHRDLDAALGAIDDGRYGLQASIFTRDVGKVLRAWDRLEVGAVIHDDFTNYRVDHMPYGGVRDSGSGREGPRYAVREMTEPRLLVLSA